MEFLERYISCTAAGSGSQNWFETDGAERITCRAYFRLSRGVRSCALLYSNLIDSTYADGSRSHANFVPGEWTILSLRAGAVKKSDIGVCFEPDAFTQVLFDGHAGKRVRPGEIFESDPFAFSAGRGEYMCLEMVFSGRRVPCHTESLLPAFRLTEDGWQRSTEMPFPCMIGTEREGETRVGLIGDSITQGIGTEANSYTHVAALLQDALGPKTAVWNLGLGYGRAHDAALDGSWLFRARHNDIVSVCFGVNDLLQTGNAEQLKKDLTYIVRALKQSGVKTLIQTVPPFDYAPGLREKWMDVNAYIRGELALEADAVFDNVPVLCRSEDEPHMSRYGAHPNKEGNAAWAEKLLPVLKTLLPKD